MRRLIIDAPHIDQHVVNAEILINTQKPQQSQPLSLQLMDPRPRPCWRQPQTAGQVSSGGGGDTHFRMPQHVELVRLVFLS